MKTLQQLLETFKLRGDSTAIIYRSGVRRFTCSYGELYLLACKMSSCLAYHGVAPGDRVILWGPNSPAWGIAFWGVVARGAVLVPVDFMSGVDRAQTIAALSAASFTLQSRAKQERIAGLPMLLLEDLEALLGPFAPAPLDQPSSADEVAELVYTSGTTGAPKGVVLTQRNLLANVSQVTCQFQTVTGDYRFLSLLPLSHMFEQTAGFLTPLYLGGSIIYLRSLKPSAIMGALADENVSALIAVPRLLQLLKGAVERELGARGALGLLTWLRRVAARLPRSMRRMLFFPLQRRFGRNFKLIVSGGAPLGVELFAFWNDTGFTLVEGYGLSECSPVLTANRVEQQLAGSVGWPLTGVEIRIEHGEVQARGENVFSGYYGNGAATGEAFTADGWFRTGDMGEFADSGALIIKGRLKELIVTAAGINIYPDEIEALLLRTAGVRDGCIVGLDRGGGEEVHAVLVPDESGRPLDQIVTEVNSCLDELHRITSFSRWPELELPKTTTLKVRKFLVRERLLAAADDPGAALATSDRLAVLIAQHSGCQLREVTEAALLVLDLGLTSIARLELVNALEQELRIDLDDTVIGPRTTVSDLRGIIRRRETVPRPQGLRLWTASQPFRRFRAAADLLLHLPLFKLCVELQTAGSERLASRGKPVLFIANHSSYLDQPAIMYSLPPAWRYHTATAAWAEFFFVNFSNPLQRIWKRLAFEYCTLALGVFPLPQSSGFRGTLQHMGQLLDRGDSILVFPEGARTMSSGLLPFQKGLALMVQEFGVPVVPVAIKGLEQVLPRGAKWPVRGKVLVTFGEPLELATKCPEEIVRLAEEAVRELLATGSG